MKSTSSLTSTKYEFSNMIVQTVQCRFIILYFSTYVRVSLFSYDAHQTGFFFNGSNIINRYYVQYFYVTTTSRTTIAIIINLSHSF